MATMLEDFLKEHGIGVERLITVSKALEARGLESRGLATARAKARQDKKTYAELELKKPVPLGRGVSADIFQRALRGEPLPRIARKKIVRAVNASLVSQKKEAVEWRQLFADVRRKTGKKKS